MSEQLCDYLFNTAIGDIVISSAGESIIAIRPASGGDLRNVSKPCAAAEQAAAQLEEYLAGQRREFDLPIKPRGTQFQLAVWDALRAIPYGETRSYKQVAEAVGNPKAARAVGMANNRNPLLIVVPCHRVIGSGGKLVGYAAGVELKERLLQLEKQRGTP